MNETKTTEPSVRFPHISSPGHALARPLPEELASKVPKARREHEELVGRVEQASREYARLRAELADAPTRDRQARTNAALAGEELPGPTEPKLRAELEQAKGIRVGLDDALRRSADRLLAAAVDNAATVAGELEQRLGDGAAEVRARLADLREAVVELGEAYSSAAWTRALAEMGEEGTISPFTAGRSTVMQSVAGELRTVEQAFDHDLANAEERRRQVADEREHRRLAEEQWQRERKQREKTHAAEEGAEA
jgi:hypothetical protein